MEDMGFSARNYSPRLSGHPACKPTLRHLFALRASCIVEPASPTRAAHLLVTELDKFVHVAFYPLCNLAAAGIIRCRCPLPLGGRGLV